MKSPWNWETRAWPTWWRPGPMQPAPAPFPSPPWPLLWKRHFLSATTGLSRLTSGQWKQGRSAFAILWFKFVDIRSFWWYFIYKYLLLIKSPLYYVCNLTVVEVFFLKVYRIVSGVVLFFFVLLSARQGCAAEPSLEDLLKKSESSSSPFAPSISIPQIAPTASVVPKAE